LEALEIFRFEQKDAEIAKNQAQREFALIGSSRPWRPSVRILALVAIGPRHELGGLGGQFICSGVNKKVGRDASRMVGATYEKNAGVNRAVNTAVKAGVKPCVNRRVVTVALRSVSLSPARIRFRRARIVRPA